MTVLRSQRRVPAETLAAARNRGSLRETDLIRIPQLTPPTNQPCERTHHGFAPDRQSRAARVPATGHYSTVTALVTVFDRPRFASAWTS